ncbi:hypothetical protein PoB_002014400 [Plakobranchus ocellatus]|uniref:ISXO2-like transposase domain-containing protein n=1 Tax=Plakobranchus ocellatus TaxID=259542 RepID=A0AAV3ZIC5_9GAST|nr:hypothetical protein PoB_002014400 [Plakobranchus ocellatus]
MGNVIYPDTWWAYAKLGEIGYRHYQVNHSKNFVNPEGRDIHTQHIEPLWRDIKRRCTRAQYLYQYLERYLFLRATEPSGWLHRFLAEAARLYLPQCERVIEECTVDSDNE